MGIVKEELGRFTLERGNEYIIEYNEGDIIHIEIDGTFQIKMGKETFLEFVDLLKQGEEELASMKNYE